MNRNRIQKIEKDILLIENSIGANKISLEEAGELVETLVYTYKGDIEGISEGLERYTYYGSKEYYKDLIKIKMRLELLLATLRDGLVTNDNGNKDNSINIINSNKNDAVVNNNIDMKFTFDEIIRETEDNPYIGDELRTELIETIKELQSISESDLGKVKKWSNMKDIIKWVSTQGVDIGIKLLPLITESLNT